MKLRIISGELKGRFLSVPGSSSFRPTLERTRESVAEILKTVLPGAVAADICAGSGAFGFEMISRGALKVDFIEQDRTRASLIRRNAEALGVEDRVRVITSDARTFVRESRERYDVVFYDPPYDDGNLQELLPSLMNLLRENGILVYERKRGQREKTPPSPGDKPKLYDARLYGESAVEFYRMIEEEI